MRTLMLMLALISAFASAPALAEPGGSFTLRAASGYVWRGIAQADQDIVYQADARYEDAAGFYARASGTEVSRASYPLPADVDLRAEFVAGLAVKTQGALGWDLGVTVVRYDESGPGFEEAFLDLTYGEWRMHVAHDWDNDNTYARFGGEFDLGSGLFLTLFGGRFSGDTVPAYKDYGAGLSTLAAGWRIALDFTGTDIEPKSDATGSQTVLSVSRTF